MNFLSKKPHLSSRKNIQKLQNIYIFFFFLEMFLVTGWTYFQEANQDLLTSCSLHNDIDQRQGLSPHRGVTFVFYKGKTRKGCYWSRLAVYSMDHCDRKVEGLTQWVGQGSAGLCEDLREFLHILAAFLQQQQPETKNPQRELKR